MHILIAPDSFKESLSSFEVAKAIQKGLQKSLPQATFDLMPIGDGGEGTLEALVEGLHLTYDSHIVTGALGNPIRARYAINHQMAAFEMADICGLERIPEDKRFPLMLTTKGIGEMICHLANLGVKQILVGVGGSATNDGGIGMASGLGYRFFDDFGQEVEAIGFNLGKIKTIARDTNYCDFSNVHLSIITDVINPLCGMNGATYVFGYQKGLPRGQFAIVDKDMKSFYQRFFPKMLNVAGSGSGGGMGAGLVAFANAKLLSGIDAVLDILNFDNRVSTADIVIIGEGCLDKQSLYGKAPIGIAKRTPKDKLLVAICGCLKYDLPAIPFDNIQAVFPVVSSVSPDRKSVV